MISNINESFLLPQTCHSRYPWVCSSSRLAELALPLKKRLSGLTLQDFAEVKTDVRQMDNGKTLSPQVQDGKGGRGNGKGGRDNGKGKQTFVPQPYERPITRQQLKRLSPKADVTEKKLEMPAKKPRLSEGKKENVDQEQTPCEVRTKITQTLAKKRLSKGRKKKGKNQAEKCQQQ